MPMKRLNVRVHGFVQSVGFRNFVRKNADLLSVRGWVKNSLDGTVEAVFEGEESAVSELVEKCKKGPALSWVEKVETREESPENEFDKFTVLK